MCDNKINRESRVFKWNDEFIENENIRKTSDPDIDIRTSIFIQQLKKLNYNWNNVLDLGCGSGYTSLEIKRKFPQITVDGVDLSETSGYVFEKKQIGTLYNEDVTKFVGKELYDVVFSFEVIEHLTFPADLIKNAEKNLVNGGYCFISTPYHGFIKNLLIILSGKFESHFDVTWDHIRFFSKQSLSDLITANSNFRVVDVLKYGRGYPVYRSMMFVLKKEE